MRVVWVVTLPPIIRDTSIVRHVRSVIARHNVANLASHAIENYCLNLIYYLINLINYCALKIFFKIFKVRAAYHIILIGALHKVRGSAANARQKLQWRAKQFSDFQQFQDENGCKLLFGN